MRNIFFWNSLNQVKCDSKSPFHWVHGQLNHNHYWIFASSWFVSGFWFPTAHRPHCPRPHGPFRSGDSGISVPFSRHENHWRAGRFCTWSSSLWLGSPLVMPCCLLSTQPRNGEQYALSQDLTSHAGNLSLTTHLPLKRRLFPLPLKESIHCEQWQR